MNARPSQVIGVMFVSGCVAGCKVAAGIQRIDAQGETNETAIFDGGGYVAGCVGLW